MGKLNNIWKWFVNIFKEDTSQWDELANEISEMKNALNYRREINQAQVKDLVIVVGDMNMGLHDLKRIIEDNVGYRVHLIRHPEQLMGLKVDHFMLTEDASSSPLFDDIINTLYARIR